MQPPKSVKSASPVSRDLLAWPGGGEVLVLLADAAVLRSIPSPSLFRSIPPPFNVSQTTFNAKGNEPGEQRSRTIHSLKIYGDFAKRGRVPLAPGTIFRCTSQVSDRYRSSAEAASEQLRLMKEAQLLQDQLKRSTQRYARSVGAGRHSPIRHSFWLDLHAAGSIVPSAQ